MTQCPLCDSTNVKAVSDDPLDMIWRIDCKICGGYILTSRAKDALGCPDVRKQRAKISAYLREREIQELPPVMLMLGKEDRGSDELKINIYEVINRFPEQILDRVDRALINLGRLSKHTGDTVSIHPELHYPIMYADTDKKESTEFMIYSLRDFGFIQEKWTAVTYDTTITPRGWQHIYEIQRGGNKKSNNAFVAMWFKEEMDFAWENGFRKGIEDAGYKAVRIDNVEHNNKICDEIIAEIRKSRFIVCDFTGQRGGVYFEAGFGLGLGMPVIWTCREDHADQLHFDTRQYSHIIWKDESELREKLKNRILATVAL